MNQKNYARLAGFNYLIVVATGMFSLAYVPGQLYVSGNPGHTFQNIRNNEGLFRLGIVSSVICYLAFLLLPVMLSKLFLPVQALYTRLMMTFVFVSIPVSIVNLQNKFAILSLVSEAKKTPADGMDEVVQQSFNYLMQYDQGIFLSTIFWGLWLLPFGILVYKSGFLPRFLGILLVLGSAGYLINFFGITLSNAYVDSGAPKYIRLLPAIAELGTCCWLLIIGLKKKYT